MVSERLGALGIRNGPYPNAAVRASTGKFAGWLQGHIVLTLQILFQGKHIAQQACVITERPAPPFFNSYYFHFPIKNFNYPSLPEILTHV